MRTKILAASLTISLGLGSTGCKTASKMAWWKTADNAEVGSTAIAHSAPTLPSDTAKRAESLASTDVNITTGAAAGAGAAAPFAPSVTPTSASPFTASTSPATYPGTAYPSTSYPSTAAAGNAPAASPQVGMATPDSSHNLGTVTMPYNPQAVPPGPRAAGASVAATRPGQDRYGNSSATSAAASNSPASPAAPYSNGQNQYAAATSSPGQAVGAASGEAAPGAGFSENPSANLTATAGTPVRPSPDGNRYGNPGPTTASLPPALAQSGPITPTPNSATAPYRPGGTGDYPQASLELASRPQAPAANSSYDPRYTPPAEPVPAQQPRYR